jgi:hypothetical protein
LWPRRRSPRRRSLQVARLRVESLEARCVLSTSGLNSLAGSQPEVEPNDTVDQAQLLGDLSTLPATSVVGSIGNSPAAAADVDWYSFTLDGPAHVSLDLQNRGKGAPLDGVLSLYNNDQFDFTDVYDPLGYRLLTQAAAGPSGDARIERDLGPGTYEVAVSGAGNLYFHPLMAGSGLGGSIGDYNIQLSATPLNLGPNDGPAVLTSDPAASSVLSASPFVIRLDLGSALDPTTVVVDQTVRLTYNPKGTFGDSNDQDVPLAWVNVGAGGTEVQLAPNAPLAPGFYQVFLAGDSSTGSPVVADVNETPLGATAAHPDGQDFTETFQVKGIKGQTGPDAASDDTPANAHNLGNITRSNLVQVAGAIGNDPFYNNSDPAHNPANDVDLYHFQITGPGRYAVVAEVWAGRIGSPLDPGVSLYRLNPADGSLEFLAGNNDTTNKAPATDGSNPLFLDSLSSQGLTAGDYYVAVADGANTPSPAEGQLLGSPGLLDPSMTHSAQNGSSTGPYVLNLLVQPAPSPPTVIQTSPASGAVLTQPPTQLTVQFNEPVNIQQQAYDNFLATGYCTSPAAYIEGSDGTKYYPRFDSYKPATNQVILLMLDRLPPGTYGLHLSGPGGLADLGGNPLVGNDPSGDFVLPFTVTAPDPVQTSGKGPGGQIVAQPDANGSQDLGALFPYELQAGITLVDTPGGNTTATATAGAGQTYQFTLLQDASYFFTLSGSNLPAAAHLELLGANGKTIPSGSRDGGATLFGEFPAGSYSVIVVGVPPGAPYQIRFTLAKQVDSPIPLVYGPTSALQLHFNTFTLQSPLNGSSSTSTGTGSTNGSTGSSTPDPTSGSPTRNASSPTSPTATETTGTSSPAPGPMLIPLAPSSDGSGIAPAASSPAVSTALAAGPLGTPTASVASTSAAVVTLAEHETTGAASQAENLVSANLALLGVGPVGGVSPSGSLTASVQVVQVSIPVQVNSLVPVGLVSLVTLTRSGEFGEPVGPVPDPEREPPSVALTGVIPAAEAAATAAAAATVAVALPAPDSRIGHVENPTRTVLTPEEETSTLPGEPGPARESLVANEAAGPARTETLVPAGLAVATKSEASQAGGVPLGDTGTGSVEALATASGPWLLMTAVLATVTLYLRHRRLARGKAVRQFSSGGPPARGPFRLWGLRSTQPHWRGAQPGRTPGPASSRSKTPSRPRHLINP